MARDPYVPRVCRCHSDIRRSRLGGKQSCKRSGGAWGRTKCQGRHHGAQLLAFIEAWLGAARAGVVYVPINTDYKGDILAFQLAKADATHIVIDPALLTRLDAVAPELPKLAHVILTSATPEAPRVIGHGAIVTTLSDLMLAPDRDPRVEVMPWDPLAISFTSGTTGRSKGVLASHAHVTTFARDWIRAVEFAEGQSIYSCMPLFHAVASWLGVVPAIIMDGRIAISSRFSASGFWDDVRRFRADVAHGIFSMVPILMKQPPRPDDADQPARRFYFAQGRRGLRAPLQLPHRRGLWRNRNRRCHDDTAR